MLPQQMINRRFLLKSCGMGMGWLALPHLMANELAANELSSGLDHVPQHYPVKAKYVIHILPTVDHRMSTRSTTSRS